MTKDMYPLRTYCRSLMDNLPWGYLWLVLPTMIFWLPLAVAWELMLLCISDSAQARNDEDAYQERAKNAK